MCQVNNSVSGNFFGVEMELGSCAGWGGEGTGASPAHRGQYWKVAGTRKVDWAPLKLMDGICAEQCKCNFRNGKLNGSIGLPPCKDEPDDPAAGKWCSLCGPKYNQPIGITEYICTSVFAQCRGPRCGRRGTVQCRSNPPPVCTGKEKPPACIGDIVELVSN